MATLTKKTRARKGWSKGAFLRSHGGAARVERRDPFEISAQEASVLMAAIQQPREISPALKSLVIETARHCSMQP